MRVDRQLNFRQQLLRRRDYITLYSTTAKSGSPPYERNLLHVQGTISANPRIASSYPPQTLARLQDRPASWGLRVPGLSLLFGGVSLEKIFIRVKHSRMEIIRDPGSTSSSNAQIRDTIIRSHICRQRIGLTYQKTYGSIGWTAGSVS